MSRDSVTSSKSYTADPTDTNNLEMQIQVVTEENERLKNDNEKLRVQFDEAVSIHSDFEKMHHENIELTSKLRASELAKDDLQRRLQLNISSFQDQLEKLKHDSSLKDESSSQEILKLRVKLDEEIKTKKMLQDQFEPKIQDLQFKYETESNKAQALEAKLKQIIESASNSFNVIFQSPDALSSYFEETKSKSSASISNDQKLSNGKKYSEIIAKMRTKLHKMQIRYQKTKDDLFESQKIIRNLQANSQKSTENLQEEIKQLKERISAQEIYHSKIVNQLNQSLSQARDEIRLKSQTTLPLYIKNNSKKDDQDENESDKHIDEFNQMHEKHLNEINNLKSQNELIIKRLQENESKLEKELSKEAKLKNCAMNQNKKYENELQELKLSFEKIKNENQNLWKQNEFIESERKTAQEELMKFVTLKQDKESKSEAALSKKIQIYENQIMNCKGQISSQQMAIQKNQNDIELIKTELKNKQEEFDLLKTKYDGILNENSNLNQQIRSLPPQIKIEDIVPSSCFNCQGVSTELSNSLNKIANSESLQPPTKIQLALSTIKSYYSKQISQLSDNLHEIQSEYNQQNKTMTLFFDQFCDLYDLQHINIKEFLCNSRKFADWFDSFKQKIEKQTLENNIRITALQEIGNRLGSICQNNNDSSTTDQQQILNRFNQTFDEYESLKTGKSKIHQQNNLLKKEKRELKSQLSEKVQNLSFELEDTRSILSTTADKLSNCAKECNNLSAAKQDLDLQLSDAKHQIEELTYINDSLTKERNSIYERSIEIAKKEVRKEIEKLNDQIRDLTNQQESIQRNNAIYKKAVNVLKIKLAQSIDAINNLKKANIKDREEFQARCEEERNNIQKTNDETTNQLRNQCSELREAMMKLNDTVNELDSKNAKLLKENSEYRRQNSRIEGQIRSQEETIERERKLMENQMQSLKIKLEANCASKISAIQSQADKERQKLIVYFADGFRGFFDPNEQIDVNMYQRLLDRAKSELKKLQNSDNAIRRLTNAMSGQSTEDAVAQYVFRTNDC